MTGTPTVKHIQNMKGCSHVVGRPPANRMASTTTTDNIRTPRMYWRMEASIGRFPYLSIVCSRP